MSDARKRAEEALATVAMRYPNGWGAYDTLSVCTDALRALLAEEHATTDPETGDQYAHGRCVGSPAPASDAVAEAAEEWAAAEAEYDATPAHSRDTDAFERNLFRRQAARRRLLAALAAAESERDRLREEKDEAPKGRPA